MAIDYDDNVNDVAFETKATDKANSSLANSTPDTVFQKAVVLEVINDPAAFRRHPDFEGKYTKETVDNYSFLKRAPRNSVLARVLNEGQGKRSDSVNVCLPFFPPHLCFPIKPGEFVWLISPAPLGKAAKVFYWMCRVPTWIDVDDVNYTHEDRIHHYKGVNVDEKDSADIAQNNEPKDANKEDPDMYGFPNGTGESDGFTIGDSEEEYDIHVTGSLAYKSFKFEPVPRLTKMPGDMVLQGSNNTSITLGTARGFKGGFPEELTEVDRLVDIADTKLEGSGSNLIRSSATIVNPEDLEAEPERELLSAAIDIVAGRSLRTRTSIDAHPIPVEDKDPAGVDMAEGHAPAFPRIKKTVHVSGSRGDEIVEVSKNPQGYVEDIENQTDNPIEGDPDFRYDASRIYVTADSSPDEDFGLSDQMDSLPAGVVVEDHDGAAIVIKSDHVRIIARKDPDTAADPKVNGSIRIIKEGPPKEPGDTTAGAPDGERAVISIEPDGTIIIDGPRIVIGNQHASAAELAEEPGIAAAGKNTNDHVYIGGVEDATYTVFLAEELGDALIAFATDIAHCLGDTNTFSPNDHSMGSKGRNSAGPNNFGQCLASIGNSGAPVFNATAGFAVKNLEFNLKRCMSKVIKIK